MLEYCANTENDSKWKKQIIKQFYSMTPFLKKKMKIIQLDIIAKICTKTFTVFPFWINDFHFLFYIPVFSKYSILNIKGENRLTWQALNIRFEHSCRKSQK